MSTPEENPRPTPVDVPLIHIGAPAESGGCGDGCGCGDGYDPDGLECGLDPALAQLLAEAGLDPVQVEDIAHVAIEEDLDGGEDVTTVATVPEDSVATGDFTAREAGVVAGLRVAEAVLSIVCTDEFEVERHVEDGDRVAATRSSSPSPPARATCSPASAARSTCSAGSPGSRPRPVPGPTCWKARRRRSATPARPLRGCAHWRSTRCAAAAGSTTGCRSWTRRSSRTTT